MKSLKDFIAVENKSLEESKKPLMAKPMDPPPVLIMRRQSIRQFGNGQRVAIYHVDKLNKYVTVPYTEMGWASEEVENVFNDLQKIVENNKANVVVFNNGSSMKVDVQTALAVLKVHSALNEENKNKISEMAHESKEQFKRVSEFAWKHVTYKSKD